MERQWPGPARSKVFDIAWAATLTVLSVGALWVKPRGVSDLRDIDVLGVGLALVSSVELTLEGDPRPLPSGVDLSAYRIVQEALTNAFKHAGPAHAVVRVCYGDDALEVQVVDYGRGAAADVAAPGGGNGLVGMRERVALFGGDLLAGPRAGGGYEVRARLPLST